MTDTTFPAAAPRKLWVRALLMLLMAAAFQLAAWVLVFVAIVQLILAAATDQTNDRLRAFGSSVGTYVRQVAAFCVFATEELPFPFSDWPQA